MAAQASFSPNDPLLPKQWYVDQDRAFEAFNVLSALRPVRVAVIDSGIDLSHPELQGRVVVARSFVGDPLADIQGHGTFVAGEIAAAVDNGRGIAGLAPSARLLVAKVVRDDDGTVSPKAEARAIRWAVNRGARVINVSLGSVRDPEDSGNTGFSRIEQRAVNYATARHALVVAAVGNNTYAPTKPWRYASFPAALPHVLGVGSYDRSGDVSSFSNRDEVYVDVIAPGEDMLSLFPRPLTAKYFELRRAGLLELRLEGVPPRVRDVLLGSAGERSRGDPVRDAALPEPGPGLDSGRADRHPGHSRQRLRGVLGQPGCAVGLGEAGHQRGGAGAADEARARPRPL